MDLAVLANFLLFLGAFGAAFSAESSAADTTEDPDALYNSTDYSRTDDGTRGDDDITADTDNLAWFLDSGDDTLTGSSARDYADLGNGDDHAAMGAGNDIVEAGAGDDSVGGGNGNDMVLGDGGDDSLSGDLGDDSLAGGDGMDWLTGGSGADVLSGGNGDDVLTGFNAAGGANSAMTTADGSDQLFGGAGNDALMLGRGDAGTGGAGEDTFSLDARWRDGSGLFRINDFSDTEDTIEIVYAASIDPNTSLPTIPRITVETSADGASALIRMNGTLIGQVDGAAGLSASSIVLTPETDLDTAYQPGNYTSEVQGTDEADSYSGTTDPTAWITGDGADSVTGSSDSDYARLGEGDDDAAMGEGDDSVRGEAGNDDLAGEAGQDTLHGGDGQDSIDGGTGNDVLVAGLGNDLVAGGAGADSVLGGGGDDTVSGYSDTNGGEDSLTAIDGIDTLSGGDGNDTLILGLGDVATGGSGTDTFQIDAAWDEGSQIATITDFVRGTDHIELEYTPVLNAAGVEIPPVVAVLMGPNNAYAVITLNSDPVAHVTGATTLTLADISLLKAAA